MVEQEETEETAQLKQASAPIDSFPFWVLSLPKQEVQVNMNILSKEAIHYKHRSHTMATS